MKNLFFSMMCLSAFAFTFSACGEDSTDEPQNPGGGTTDPIQLTTPAVTATGGEGQFTSQWDAVENASAYIVQYGNQEETVTETAITREVAAGDYTVKVKATTDKSGYIESEWGEATVTVAEPKPVISDGTWFGTWTVKSTHTMRYYTNDGFFIEESYDPTPKEFEISINQYQIQGKDTIQFYGWTSITDDRGNQIPGIASIDKATGNLRLLAGDKLGNAQGMPIAWTALIRKEDNITFETQKIPAITFSMKGDNATATYYEGEQNGKPYTVVGIDVFGVQSGEILLLDLPLNIPAGEFTMVKTANAAQTPEKAYVEKTYIPNILNTLKLKIR